ncbi:6,7-dimethyl-8-ribityllumazine synthase [Patescibacteria group bacterium]|nr:6,7-dimethyl-8-ribityllumazine synthase [Patescibacteria group bacterium]
MSEYNHSISWKAFNASSYRVGIVSGQFNTEACESLIARAQEKLSEYQVPEDHIDVFRVAGSAELPVVLKHLAETEKYDVLVALGVIIRGQTVHFDYVAKIATEGILRVQMDYGIPIGFGVLMLETQDQLVDRIRVGGDAVEAVLQSKNMIKNR